MDAERVGPDLNHALDMEDRILVSIRRLMRAVDLHSRRLVDDFGLTGPQLATLREVHRATQLSASALARAVHLSGPTMTGILTRLERRGLLRRERGESDRRTVWVSLTPLGEQVLSEAPSLLQERFRAGLSALEDWERLQILATLQRIAAMMDATELDASPHLVAGERAFEADRLAGGADSDAPEPPAGDQLT